MYVYIYVCIFMYLCVCIYVCIIYVRNSSNYGGMVGPPNG